MTRNMKSKLAIKFPTPNEWSSNALPPVRLSSSNSLPPGQEKASNAWGMPGEGDGDVGTLVFAQLGITLNLCTRKVSKMFKVVKVMTTHGVYRQCQLPVVDLSNFKK